MSTFKNRRLPDLISILLYGLLFLFFFQLLTGFVEAIYAFGLLGTSIPPEIASVLFFFSPLLLLLFPRGLSRVPLLLLGELVVLARAAAPLLDTRGKMLVAGLGTGAFLVFFPALLWALSRRAGTYPPPRLGAGLALGLSLSIFFHALGSGVDLSTGPSFQWIGWVLALLAGILLILELRPEEQAAGDSRVNPPAGFGRLLSLALGITSVFVLLYFAFTNPSVITRWTEAPYALVVLLIGLGAFLFAVQTTAAARVLPAVVRLLAPLGSILFVVSLLGTILANQVTFPAGPAAYPLDAPGVPVLAQVPLILMLLLFPVVLVDFSLFTRAVLAARPSFRALGAAFSLVSLYLLGMVFAHVFTTVYDYIPVIGPFFRDKFWLVHLIPGLLLLLPLLRIGRDPLATTAEPGRVESRAAFVWMIAGLSILSLAAVLLLAPRPEPRPDPTSLRVLTYNIQQGYSAAGLKNYTGQLELIRQVDADLIGLQESDSARISGGNTDLVRYFADRLDLYTYYGPRTVTGTFGIALLSKYPIEEPRTFYMYSAGEQTATIAARITLGGKSFDVFVTHLGNDGPLIQQEQLLQEIPNQGKVIAMGDFNFRPDSEQYHLTTARLDDAWLLRWPEGVDAEGFNPAGRIDHIFVSPGIQVTDIRYLRSPASDHPAVVADINW